MVPHRGTNWAAPWLTSQIGRDAVLSRSYGRGYILRFPTPYLSYFSDPTLGFHFTLFKSQIDVSPTASKLCFLHPWLGAYAAYRPCWTRVALASILS